MNVYPRSRLILLALLGLSCFSIASVQANPVFRDHPMLKDGSLKNPTDSRVLADDGLTKKVWVLPPGMGRVVDRGLIKNPDLEDGSVQRVCNELEDLLDTSRGLQKETVRIMREISGLLDRLDGVQDEVFCIEVEILKVECLRNDLQAQVFVMQQLLIEKRGLLEALQEDLDLACAKGEEECEELKAQVERAKSVVEEFEIGLECLQEALDRVDGRIEDLEADIDHVWESFDEQRIEIETRQEEVLNKEAEVLDMYREYARMPGDRARFSYTVGLQENLEALRRENPGFAFHPVNASDVRLDANFIPAKTQDDHLTRVPSVLGFEIEGQKVEGGTLAFEHLPESFEGFLQLSMVATCPARKAEQEGLAGRVDRPRFGTVATYAFEANVGFVIEVCYHRPEVVQFLAEKWKSIGFSSLRDVRIAARELIQLDIVGFQYGPIPVSDFELKIIEEDLVAHLVESIVVVQGQGSMHNVHSLSWEQARNNPVEHRRSSALFQGYHKGAHRFFGTHWRLDDAAASSSETRSFRTGNDDTSYRVHGSVTYVPE